MKKFFAITISFVAMISFLSTPVRARVADDNKISLPMYEIAQNPLSKLSISSSTGSCYSEAKGTDVTKITATQTLEKYNGSSWDAVKDASWTSSVNSNSICVSNSKSGLSSGKYRLKTVFTLTDNDGKTETVTVYSTTASC